MFSIVKYYKIWFAVSGILVLAAIVLLVVWGLKPGIDFRGGLLLEAKFSQEVPQTSVREALLAIGLDGVIIQPAAENVLLIKTKPIGEKELSSLKATLTQKFGEYQELRLESIGPTIGRELARKAYWQIILVVLGILLYMAYAFRKIKSLAKSIRVSSWHMGLATILALLHDILIPVGVFVVLGKLAGVEIDSLFITALLTILGFSVHDTIVVFDRIRENIQKYPYKSLAALIDYSVSTTLARSINTSSTLILVLVAMLLFGGETILHFVLALLVGVVAGTYSSIFIASPILYLLDKRRNL